uniref:Uncharacterized protein n=1 Tax=Trichobilharzia regenti TaxID=157069 RepID=A0AA85J5Q6_TRIRE|nr:unnamed protein product [Trichobilharzia regenti]
MPFEMMGFSVSQLGFVIVFITVVLSEVNGQQQAVVFNLRDYLLDIWRAFCYRMVQTWGCFLDWLSPDLGGKNSTCLARARSGSGG